MGILSVLLPGKRARKEFAGIIESLYDNKTVVLKSVDERLCNSSQMKLKDFRDYAEKNFSNEELTKQNLAIAYNLCAGCKRLPEDNNCDEVFRRIGLAKDYLTI